MTSSTAAQRSGSQSARTRSRCRMIRPTAVRIWVSPRPTRSEEHTSELQSPYDLVCRLLLEKKKKKMLASLKLIMQYENDNWHLLTACSIILNLLVSTAYN